MAELFGVDKSGISRHLKNIFATKELEEKEVVAKIATTTPHGAIVGKTQHHETTFYRRLLSAAVRTVCVGCQMCFNCFVSGVTVTLGEWALLLLLLITIAGRMPKSPPRSAEKMSP